jgi:Flp pilus assembly protein TadD
MAIAVKPTMGKAYFMRGQCAEKLNDLASARRDYIQALNFLPNEPEIETALNKIQDK